MQLDEWLCIGIPDDVMEQASAWLARLDADHVSLDERQQLSVWLDEDPLHRWAFEELSQLNARVASLSHVRGQIHAPQVMIFPQVAAAPDSPMADYAVAYGHNRRWHSIIALLLIAIGLTFALQAPHSPPKKPHHFHQPPGFEQIQTNGE